MGSLTARVGIAGFAASALVAATFGVAPGAGAAHHHAAAAKLGRWASLGGAQTIESGTPAIWQDSKHRASVLWLRGIAGSDFTYDVAPISATGKVGTTADAFAGGHWGSLSNEPTLISSGNHPLVVFSGIKGTSGDYATGCIFGAEGSSQPWTLEPWSLSHSCFNPVGSAGEDKTGTIAAAWGGGNSILYRVGTSPTIPAANPDSSIPLSAGADPYKTGVAADTGGNDDFYIGWAQEFSNPASHDGIYVQDVTAGGSTMKAPGSNTDTINRIGVFTNLAMTARSGHPGVYLAYCTNGQTCKLKLWHVGSTKAMSVPGTPGAGGTAIASGPGGRLWVAWFDESTTKVYVTRTNQKVSKFGPVRSYKTPCSEHGILGISSGSSGRLDVALQCIANSNAKTVELFTQVEVGLHVTPSTSKVRNTKKHTVTMTVTDAGDRVSGAKVKFDGATKSTNSKGKASFTIVKHAKPGKYVATATKSQYLKATTHVTVTT